MKQRIPLNPKSLRWARESANILIEDVAAKLGKQADVIEAWERGAASPTYLQLERLAYEIYKRPIAIFFFPDPPGEISPRKSFRTLPESELEQLPVEFLRVFRRAQAMQINLEELSNGENPAPKKIFRDLSLRTTDGIQHVAKDVRRYLGTSLQAQVAWRDTNTALKQWRLAIERSGIFIFKAAFSCDEISGFCIYDAEFPIIYVNNSMSQTRQIFTLFHEVTHLLYKTGGIDKTRDEFIARIRGDKRKIEVCCNRFAGEFLVPNSDFQAQIRDIQIDDERVEKLANRYKVSREVILRKCLDRRLVGQDYYERKAAEWAEEARKLRKAASGGNYYNNAVSYLGESYLSLVFKKYYQNRFPLEQLADYLAVKVRSIPGLETAFLGRG